jgi:hypothetical protein
MRSLAFLIVAVALAGQVSAREDYVALWGPRVGTEIPMLEPVDYTGKGRSLDDLAGPNGLLLSFNRTTDW